MKIDQRCQHLDYDNKLDCDAEPDVRCLCCGSWACAAHGRGRCPYGGEPFIEVDE